jgi:tetratricopeptide (TPR) repeat protein
MITNCLTYEQLQAYSADTIKTAEREHLYMHISSCELCAGAVNGFTAFPFASDELVAIHREIDARTNATVANPLTMAQVFIVIISLLSIAGVYLYANHTPENKAIANAVIKKESTVLIPEANETKNASAEEISSAAKTFKKIVNVIPYKKSERRITPVEQLEMIKPLNVFERKEKETNGGLDIVAPHFNSDVLYIYDLKVSDYNKLYFNHAQPDVSLFKRHTPVFKENKESVADDFGVEKHMIPADRILKEGLAAFNKQQFTIALDNFNLLLKNNQEDVNAQFYSALSYYNLNKTDQAIERLQLVVQNTNDTFYPEAQWCLALLAIKSGNMESAKAQLETIVSEKGFYAKKAKEKLRVSLK